jgi:hypothetical protein
MNITTIQDHINVLRAHNEWRRGGDGPMTNPKALGVAIEAVCGELEAMQRQIIAERAMVCKLHRKLTLALDALVAK